MVSPRDEALAKKIEGMSDKAQIVQIVRDYVNQELDAKIQRAEMVFSQSEKVRMVLEVCLAALRDSNPTLANRLEREVRSITYVQ